MIIYVVRHGLTAWNKKGITQGHKDSPLAPEGVASAKKLRGLLNKQDIEVIFSSDLGRCVQTAEIINKSVDKDLIKISELREQDFGDHNGQPYEKIKAEIDISNPDKKPPNGESFNEMKKRVLDFIKALSDKRFGKVLLVTHHGCLIAILSEYYKVNRDSDKCQNSDEKAYRFELVDGKIKNLEVIG